MPTRPPRSTAAPRSRLALGSIAAATLLLVGAGAFAAGRSTARDSAATTDPVSASGDDTSATFSTFSSVVGVTVASLEPTTTSARVAPTTVVATTTTVTLPPSTTSPSTTSPAQTPIGLDDPRVRVVADALSVDVDAWSRPPTATYGPSAIPSPAITAVASIGGAWAIDDAGDLTVQRTTAREPEVVVRADDARGRPVALATGAGVVIAVLTREADGEILVVSVLVFDGRAVAVMRPMAITATPADDAGGTSTAGPAVTGDDVPAATVVGGTDDSSSSTTEAER